MPLPVRHTPRANWHKYNGAEYFIFKGDAGKDLMVIEDWEMRK